MSQASQKSDFGATNNDLYKPALTTAHTHTTQQSVKLTSAFQITMRIAI